jgi:hypothetical protein
VADIEPTAASIAVWLWQLEQDSIGLEELRHVNAPA